jgi:hypothetical protein
MAWSSEHRLLRVPLIRSDRPLGAGCRPWLFAGFPTRPTSRSCSVPRKAWLPPLSHLNLIGSPLRRASSLAHQLRATSLYSAFKPLIFRRIFPRSDDDLVFELLASVLRSSIAESGTTVGQRPNRMMSLIPRVKLTSFWWLGRCIRAKKYPGKAPPRNQILPRSGIFSL